MLNIADVQFLEIKNIINIEPNIEEEKQITNAAN